MNPTDSRTRTFEMPKPMGKGLVFVIATILVLLFPVIIVALIVVGGLEFVRRFKLP